MAPVSITLVSCDQPSITIPLTASAVASDAIATTVPADPTRAQGLYTVTVGNGDGQTASLTCALQVVAEPPPTVTLVTPTTAYVGVPNDNVSSDQTVTILGTGFLSTPSVTFVSTADPSVTYTAQYVGFQSDTQLTAIVPSETLAMSVGTYQVIVTNPDNLGAEWQNGGTPGVITVTDTPPPALIDLSPMRLASGACTTTLTLNGTGFATGATVWIVVPAGTVCSGGSTDASGQQLCPIVVDTVMPTAVTGHFASCPALGPYPVELINPDGQSSELFDLEVTSSSSGALNTGPFEEVANGLVVPRWKHAVQYGFDELSNAFVYVAGGQDANGNVLGSVEASQFDLFGTPGPFSTTQQYGGVLAPRVPNDLSAPREGLTLVRVGEALFAVGGSTSRSDTTTPVAAATTVERASILGSAEMPGLEQPTPLGGTGLPTGAWYYRVSAVGPWGESLASREVVAPHAGGQVMICWTPPAGATSFNIYRSLSADGRMNSAAAIAFEQGGSTNCFIDTGVETHTPAPGNARATLAAGGTLPAGTYTYRVSATVPLTGGGSYETYADYAASVDVAAGNQSVVVEWDGLANVGATYSVFRLDPATGQFELLQGATGLTATSFTDVGVGFDASLRTPRPEIAPLPAGSLSTWTAAGVPQLGTAREGLDGIVVATDPATSSNQVARIIVAGGRDGSGGTYAYHGTAESLGVFVDGTTDAAWAVETPVLNHARAYHALLTTQNRNVTPFPPSNDGVAGSEPVFVVAAMGDDAFSAINNQGRADFEACGVDLTTGHLACGATWTEQTQVDPHRTFGADAVMDFSFLYPFYGVATETLGGAQTSIQFQLSSIGRYPIFDPATITNGQLLDNRQSASSSFVVPRAYYQMTRLLSYVYVVGGWAAAHTDANGNAIPAGPTGLVERHRQ